MTQPDLAPTAPAHAASRKTPAQYVAEARKALVAATGIVTEVVAAGVLHGDAAHYASVALAALTALGVYLTPNQTSPAAEDSASASS